MCTRATQALASHANCIAHAAYLSHATHAPMQGTRPICVTFSPQQQGVQTLVRRQLGHVSFFTIGSTTLQNSWDTCALRLINHFREPIWGGCRSTGLPGTHNHSVSMLLCLSAVTLSLPAVIVLHPDNASSQEAAEAGKAAVSMALAVTGGPVSSLFLFLFLCLQ